MLSAFFSGPIETSFYAPPPPCEGPSTDNGDFPAGQMTQWTVPAGVTGVEVIAIGGDGGNDDTPGGSGAIVTATIPVNSGDVLNVIVAGTASNGGGGGGTGIYNVTTGEVLIVAGGGGGGCSNLELTGQGGRATQNGGSTGGPSGGTNGLGGGNGTGSGGGGGSFVHASGANISISDGTDGGGSNNSGTVTFCYTDAPPPPCTGLSTDDGDFPVGQMTQWTVPAGVTEVTMTVKGASGYLGGEGATAESTLPVNPGDVLNIIVGINGDSYGGGGTGIYNTTTSTVLIVGGGGGTAPVFGGLAQGGRATENGGSGQAPGGTNGNGGNGEGGGGGAFTAGGGTGGGEAGVPNGGNTSLTAFGFGGGGFNPYGGGGGGYSGGGSSNSFDSTVGGGGGGSYVHPSGMNTTITAGANGNFTHAGSAGICYTAGPVCDIAIDNITPTAESCPGANDGIITVSASCTTCTGVEYSIGGSFQPGNSFSGLAPGSYTVTVRDTGDDSCEDMDNTTINLGNDTEAPTAVCDPLTVEVDEVFTAAQVDGGSTDNCDPSPSLSLSPTSYGCASVGIQVAILTVADAAGNSATCTSIITVQDNTAPTAVCQSATVELDNTGNGSLAASAIDNGSSDACGVASLTVNPNVFDCSNLGDNTVTLEVTDVNGNTATCTATANVEDNIRPSISCPADATFNNDPGTCEATFVVPSPTASDNCAVTVLRYRYRTVDAMGNDTGPWSSWSTASMQTLPIGHYKFQWQAKDASGNQRRCAFLVDVIDNEPPAAVCLDNTVFLDATGNYGLQDVDVLDFVNTTDNCGNFFVTNINPNSVDCDDFNTTIPVVVSVSDDAGNMINCTANIFVDKGTALPAGWVSSDIGSANGSAAFDPCEHEFTVTSSGFPFPNADVQHSAHTSFCGNFDFMAQITSVTGNWAGIEARESSAPGAVKVALRSNLGPILYRDIRAASNAYVNSKQIPRPNPHNWMRLVRQGNTFMGYTSLDGTNWQLAFSAGLNVGNCMELGLFTQSNNVNSVTTATFNNVTINGVAALVAPGTSVDLPGNDSELATLNLFPNPFAGKINLEVYLPENGKVNVSVFNLQGQRVATLIDEMKDRGSHHLDWDGGQLPAGVYIVRLQSKNGVIHQQISKSE